jgi:hypothetical protein
VLTKMAEQRLYFASETGFVPRATAASSGGERGRWRGLTVRILGDGQGSVEARAESDRFHNVDLDRHTCSCGAYQITGLPCVHAVALAMQAGKDILRLTHEYYHTSRGRSAYDAALPLTGIVTADLAQDSLLPPFTQRPRGRPVQRRIPSRGELLSQVRKCTYCKGSGHNRRTCPNPNPTPS